MKTNIISTDSPERTLQAGEELGRLLGPGDILCLKGDLGAGKTHFAKGVARGLGVSEPVTSPTFTLINEYYGRLPFYHMDVYRLEGAADMADLGYEEFFYGQGVTLVEWADRIYEILPDERLDIEITRGAVEDAREVRLIPRGQRYVHLVEEMVSIVCPRH